MAKQWYYQVMGAELGPLSSAELQDKVKLGLIQPDTLIRTGKDGKWVPADRWKGLLPAPGEESLPPAPPPTVKAEKGSGPPEVDAPPAASDTFSLASAGTAVNAAPPVDDDDAYHLRGETEHKPYRAHTEGDAYEFFEFVGFRSAISPPLYTALVAFTHQQKLSITQITRRAIAQFIGKPELGEDKKPEPPAEESEPAAAPAEPTAAGTENEERGTKN